MTPDWIVRCASGAPFFRVTPVIACALPFMCIALHLGHVFLPIAR